MRSAIPARPWPNSGNPECQLIFTIASGTCVHLTGNVHHLNATLELDDAIFLPAMRAPTIQMRIREIFFPRVPLYTFFMRVRNANSSPQLPQALTSISPGMSTARTLPCNQTTPSVYQRRGPPHHANAHPRNLYPKGPTLHFLHAVFGTIESMCRVGQSRGSRRHSYI